MSPNSFSGLLLEYVDSNHMQLKSKHNLENSLSALFQRSYEVVDVWYKDIAISDLPNWIFLLRKLALPKIFYVRLK